ncbi:SDR family NAD(P)-dependent oxidoreductase [Cryptosporangium aurantiacum]|uniref:NAD(P)-dependent dehydrogenase, short-chain alcohol dehydrogenase family n=1 Tax=Cryptosporangium aurantiacum TaxID=134849 RepID=A0A1M7RLF0_9ACTN|nr:SDR family oxidoreductase [Cryptosporangium aurantiacum]SHN47001.1 NAD(P)-dependent dehydrogenase, short-chain alcohol dehydrogenase family [Cryptosporangium aurantiacum]
MTGIAVVTGAAGALGRAVLAELAGRGGTVVAMDRAGDPLDEVGARDGVRVIGVDLADRASVLDAWKQVDDLGTPSGLVALAGGFVPGSLADLDEHTFTGLWEGNVSTLLWSAQQAAARMPRGSSIVTVGSKTAVTGKAPVGHAASKAAVVRITELLADELRPAGIRVNAVLPSVLDTPANRSWMSPELAAKAVRTEAVAKVIAFLLSDDATPISGARVPVYGDA